MLGATAACAMGERKTDAKYSCASCMSMLYALLPWNFKVLRIRKRSNNNYTVQQQKKITGCWHMISAVFFDADYENLW